MPKNEIDYSNTIIYKIVCKDEKISDLYVGHTTNFIKRKYLHKNACNNLNNKLKIYNIIRENGGWDNWEMIETATYNCKDHTEARIKEQEHFDLLKATLNSCPPYIDKLNSFCATCHIQCSSQKEYQKHINCELHQKKIQQGTTIFTQKNSQKYNCEVCDFNTCKKNDFERHNLTQKHKNTVLTTGNNQKYAKKFACDFCEKEYSDRAGLWRHKQKCKETNVTNVTNVTSVTNTEENISADKELIIMLLKQNTELMELLKNGTNNNHSHNTTTNSHNKSFNLQFFLNETCKDAMNIMDFVDSIQLQLSDLEKVGEIGYVEGISKIITSNLKALDVEKRPIHCTDKKREVLYIKDENKWEKEDEDKKKLRKAIKRVAGKNQRLLPKFKEAHPDCIKAASKFSDQYNKMIIESMGGSGDNDLEKEDKIIRNITKATTIDKNDDI